MFDYKKFGENFKKSRIALHMTQVDICMALDISHSHLVGIELGVKKPSAKMLVGMANTLNMSIDEIMNNKDCKTLRIQTILDSIEGKTEITQKAFLKTLKEINQMWGNELL